jgi:hypothetical protein
MARLFDPIFWLATHSTTAHLDADGRVRLRFGKFVRQEERARITRVIERHYLVLLRLQLDVEPGERPRTVRQLIAAGRVRVAEGRFVLI